MSEEVKVTETEEKPAKKTAAAKKAAAPKAAAKADAPAEKKAEVKKPEPAKKIRVTLVRSTIGCLKGQKATVAALGLRKIRQSKELPDNAAIRGMIFKVKHLVSVEEI